MIHFRSNTRSLALNVLGALSRISPGVHLLAGHYMGRNKINDANVFLDLLKKIRKQAKLVNVDTACDLITSKELVDEPLVAFTFDDGFSECYSHIAPCLEKLNINAAFFVNPGFCIGDENYVTKFTNSIVKLPGKIPMTEKQVRDLSERGFIIGAHTIDHADLTSLNEEFLTYQIAGCKNRVESITGIPCNWFAWTFGGYGHISPVALRIASENYSHLFSSDCYSSYLTGRYQVFNRRHFEPDWPITHVKYFLNTKRVYKEN